MTDSPLILITNDDGIASPGLRAAAQAVADLGELLIVAPSTQQTGAGRSYPTQINKSIKATHISLDGNQYPAYSANVSPAQAVALGVLDLATRPIDLCISGINYGENIGSGVTISGTVGAAIEAACYQIPALAVSFETDHQYHLNHSDVVDFSVSAHFTRYFAQKILKNGIPPKVDLLKIDVPAAATPDTLWQTCRVSRQRYYQSLPTEFDKKTGEARSFGYSVKIDHDTLEPDSDVKVFSVDKEVAVVPLSIDLTAPVAMANIASFFNGTLLTDTL